MEAYTTPPPMPRRPSNEPGGIPEIPSAGGWKVTFYFNREDSITIVGAGTAQLATGEDGSQLFMVSAMAVIAGGSGRYEGARGVESACGAAVIPEGVSLEPGATLHFKTFYVLKVVRAPAARDPRSSATVAPPSLPPGVDPETYELETVDRIFSRIASFTLISAAGPEETRPIRSAGRPVGLEVRQSLHRLDIVVEPPTETGGIRAANLTGPWPVAELEAEWRLIPDDFGATPDAVPPPTPLDPARSQRFMISKGRLRFEGDGDDGVEFFGTGRTFPAADPGRPRIRLGAALVVVRGWGKFRRLPGMMAWNGVLEPPQGLSTSLLLRLADLDGNLLTDAPAPLARPLPAPDPMSTFLIFKGENNFHHSTSLILDRGGQMQGAHLRQLLRLVRIGFAAQGRRGLRTHMALGPIACEMTATMHFNPQMTAPVPFSTLGGSFTTLDPAGREIGSLAASIVEGRGFPTELPGAPTPVLRGVGVAPIKGGRGILRGARGLVTVANWISIFPRQVSSIFLLRLADPEGRFRATGRRG